MTRLPRTLTYLAAWFFMLAAVGCAPPPAAKRSESRLDTAAGEAAKPLATQAIVSPVAAAATSSQPTAAAAENPPPDAAAGEWGTISGKFKFVGDAPEMKDIYPYKDAFVCGVKETLRDEHLIVGKSGELANVVVYAMRDSAKWGDAISPIHPSYESRKKTDVLLDNVNCRFEPHVVAGWTQQRFLYRNSDPSIGHNAFGQPFANPAISPLIPASSEYYVDFRKPERLPFPVSCSIHPWMKGYILVRPDPYFAVSAKDGTFNIANLPAGEFSLQLWHESLGYLKTIAVGGKSREDKKGVHAFAVKPGDNDLGEIAAAAKDYAKQLDMLK